MSQTRAAEKLGYSRSWAHQRTKERREQEARMSLRASLEPPRPLPYEDLDGGVKDTLKDFLLFREVFLCRDPVPWARDAANRIVEMLTEGRISGDRQYAVINTPPGAGKSTLFTMDIPAWLICGGGVEDTAQGRAIRIMLGHVAKTIAESYVLRLRRFLAMREPFRDYDRRTKTERVAELAPAMAFGKFKPDVAEGDEAFWTKEQFIVAQVGRDLYQKEPTVKAASYGSEFIGARVDFAVWDDPDDPAKPITIEGSESKNEWCENVAEQRVNDGGLFAIVQQRLSPNDLSGNRLKATELMEDGEEVPLYKHIKYPAHNDATCDGEHRQWEPATDDGCLLDEKRLSWRHLRQQMTKPNWLTLFQQEESDPLNVLVLPEWLEEEVEDVTGFKGIGCKDRDRAFWEWPLHANGLPIRNLIDYVVVDPSVANFWAIEWWAIDPLTKLRYMIWGDRRRLQPGTNDGFLDWDEKQRCHVGLMEELQNKSGNLGHPIRVWIVEQNAAHKYLFRTNAYKTWRQKWPLVDVISHETQKNKADSDYGVKALLPMVYKTGMKRLPYKHGDIEARNYLDRHKIYELTKYPYAKTDDTVMADWFGEYNIERVLQSGHRFENWKAPTPPKNMPEYLRRKMTH